MLFANVQVAPSVGMSVSSNPIITFLSLGVIIAARPTLDPPPLSNNSILITPSAFPRQNAAPTPAPARPACTILISSSSILAS